MKHYVFMTDINNEQLKDIRRDFKLIFKVDIADEKYACYGSIKEKWDAVINDIPLYCIGEDKELYVQEFMQMLQKALYGEQSNIIRPYDVEAKIRNDAILKFKQYVAEMQTLLDDYKIYEPDVWLNAYLSIQYKKAKDNVPDDENVGMKGCEISAPYHVDAKGIGYVIPFEGCHEGFCERYVEKILGKDQVQILGAFIYPEEKAYEDGSGKEGFLGYQKQVKLKLVEDMKYTRWKQGKVYSLEKSKEFKTEDKAMFYKTINGALVRNLVNTMISTEHIYDVEDYLYLLDKLCICKSLNWQNLIGCLYIAVSYFQRELTALGLWGDISVMFEAWIMNILVINYRLELLVSGLIYIIYEEDEDFTDITEVEEKCKDALNEIEKNPVPLSKRAEELIKREWETQKRELRVSKAVETNHRQYDWVYAIMQRYIIYNQTPRICDELWERETNWKDIIRVISAVMGNENNMTEESKKFKLIGKICAALSNKEQVTREDVLIEIKQKQLESDREGDGEINPSEVLKDIFQMFIKMEARVKHVVFENKIDHN